MINSSNDYRYLLFTFALVVALLFVSITEIVDVYPHYLISSIFILLLYLLIIIQFGLVSVPSFVSAAVAFPAIAFFWAWLNGSDYINYHNRWLQDQAYYVNKTVFLSFITILVIFSFLTINKQKFQSLDEYWEKTLELNKLPPFENVDRSNVMKYINGLEEVNERLLRYIIELEERISNLEKKE